MTRPTTDETVDAPQEKGAEAWLGSNRELWDSWTEVHKDSDFYAVDRFLAGASTLQSIELKELGDVDGLSLLHLQCHFGLDTLSWARRGARVTGVDLSPKAMTVARELASKAGLDARFETSDVLELDLGETFDVVFTSYGVLDWLPDLDRWASVVARHLKPGGRFYIVELHPVLGMLADDGKSFANGYFSTEAPIAYAEEGTYADPEAAVSGTSYTWNHSLSEVVGALLKAGLRLDFLREHDFSPYDCFPFTAEIEPGKAQIPGLEGKVPMCYSLQARR